MAEVTVRELRSDGGRVLDRVERGESLTVTRDGHVDADRLKADIDAALDSSL